MHMDQLAVAEADVDRFVDHALAAQPLVEPKLGHRVDGALLQHAGTHAVFHIGAAARFEHHAVDALAIKEMRKDRALRRAYRDFRAFPIQTSKNPAVGLVVTRLSSPCCVPLGQFRGVLSTT